MERCLTCGEPDLDPLSRVQFIRGAFMRVNSCEVETSTVQPDEIVVVGFEVENIGDAAGSYRLEVFANGQRVDVVESTSELDPGQTGFGSTGFVPSEEGLVPGTYDVSIRGPVEAQEPVMCGQLFVQEETADEPTNGDGGDQPTNGDQPTDGDQQPGITQRQAVLAVSALVAGGVAAWAFQQNR